MVAKCVCALLNHTHKFTFMNQIGKILSRSTHEVIHQIGMALLKIKQINTSYINRSCSRARSTVF